MWDSPVAVVGHPGKVKRAMFGPPFLGLSSTGGEQCGSYVELHSHPGSCRRVMLFHFITQRPSDLGRLRAEYELEAASSIRSLPPSSISPSPKGFVHKIREEITQHEEEESIC